MTRAQLAQRLGESRGYGLGTFGRRTQEGDARGEVWLALESPPGRAKVRSGCLQPVDAVDDTKDRWGRDLPLPGTPVLLWVHRCRLASPRCGPKVEHLDWLGRHQRVTRRLAESVGRLARVLPLQHVAEHFRLRGSVV